MNVLTRSQDGTLFFWCPGCQELHGVWLAGNPNPLTKAVWTWNESMDKPTFSPSILVNGNRRCHSYVKDGQIRFLADSHHRLAGQEVPLPLDPLNCANAPA